MSKLFPASICILALLFAVGFGGEPDHPGVSIEAASSNSSIVSNRYKPAQVVEHLLKAAEHLEAAGFAEESAKIRDDARQQALRDNVLSRKEAELECLQEEVDRLRVLTGQVPMVVIEIVAIEVDRAKLGLKAREFDKLVGFSQSEPAVAAGSTSGQPSAPNRPSARSAIVEANPWRLPLFRELREKGAIDVLAHPTVQTATNRPASVLVGGEVPIRVKSSAGDVSIRTLPFGTRVDVRAVVLPNHRIRLQTAVELTKINGDAVVENDGTTYPATSSRRLNNEVEMQIGQTLAVGRLVFDRPTGAAEGSDKTPAKGTPRPIAHAYAPSESVETVVFITPRLVHGVDALQPLPIVPAAATGDADEALVPADLVPADWVPNDWDVFGPVVPVLKRRTIGRE